MFFYSCLALNILNDIVFIIMVLVGMTVDSYLLHVSSMIGGAVSIFLGVMALITFFKIKKILEINGTTAIPKPVIYLNCFTVILMMVFSVHMSSAGISNYDIGYNFANVCI